MVIYKIAAAFRSLGRIGRRTKKQGHGVSWHGKTTRVTTNSYGQARRNRSNRFESLKKKCASFSRGKIALFKKKSFLSRAEKRKIIRGKAVRVGASLILVFLLIFGLKNPVQNMLVSIELFHIEEVVVNGNRTILTVDIKTMADCDYNTSLFSVKPSEIAERLAKHPWIKYVNVRRQWPSVLHIEVEEHDITALLAVGASGKEKFYYLNDDGKTIAPVQAGQDIDFPVITGVADMAEGAKASALHDALVFLRLTAGNDPNLPAQSVSEIHFESINGMVVRLVEFPFPIYFGSGEVKKKYKQLRKVLAVLYKKRTGNINISQVEYIRMDYLENKVLIAQAE